MLLTHPKETDSPSDDDKETEKNNINLSDFPDRTIGDKVTYTQDRVVSKCRITSVLLDPSWTQIQFTVKCDDQNVIQTTQEFLKFDHNVDVSKIP